MEKILYPWGYPKCGDFLEMMVEEMIQDSSIHSMKESGGQGCA